MKDFNDNKNYYEFIIDSIKVYIHKSLDMEENIEIKQLFSFPLLGSSFKVSGINIKHEI